MDAPRVLRNEARAVETEIKFAGYLEQQKKSIEKLKAAEAVAIPEWIEYGAISGLSREMRETLERVRPVTIGQASRIPGVTPAALSLVHVSIRLQGARRPSSVNRPLVALIALAEERNVKGQLGIGLLLGLGAGIFAHRGALGVDAQPAAVGALEDVRENAFFLPLGGIDLAAQNIGSVGHGDIAQHAHCNHVLIEANDLVVAGNHQGHLLVAGGNVSRGGNVNE